MIFKNLYRNTDYIIVAFFIAISILPNCKYFRFTDYRWAYQLGSLMLYLFHIVALLISILNSVLIFYEIRNTKEKIILLLISLIPVYFWIYLIFL